MSLEQTARPLFFGRQNVTLVILFDWSFNLMSDYKDLRISLYSFKDSAFEAAVSSSCMQTLPRTYISYRSFSAPSSESAAYFVVALRVAPRQGIPFRCKLRHFQPALPYFVQVPTPALTKITKIPSFYVHSGFVNTFLGLTPHPLDLHHVRKKKERNQSHT